MFFKVLYEVWVFHIPAQIITTKQDTKATHSYTLHISYLNRPTFSEYVHVPLWRDGWRYVVKIALSSRGMLLFPTLIAQHRGWATPPSKITQNSTNIVVTYYVFWVNVHGCLFHDSAMCKSFDSAHFNHAVASNYRLILLDYLRHIYCKDRTCYTMGPKKVFPTNRK